MVQIQLRKHVLDHADYVSPTRQHELDHTDQEAIGSERCTVDDGVDRNDLYMVYPMFECIRLWCTMYHYCP